MIVRKITPVDYSALTNLINELGYPTSLTDIENRMGLISNHADYHTFVAELNNKVVGAIGVVKCLFYEKDGGYMRIVLLITEGAYRNNGIGQALLKQAEELAVSQN